MVSSKRFIIHFLTLLITLFAGTNFSFGQENQFLLSDLKESILSAISDAKALSDTEPHFLIKSIDLILQGKTSVDGGGGFSIPIFEHAIDLGAEGSSSISDKLTLQLKPTQSIVVGGEQKINLAALIKDLKSTFKREKDSQPTFILTSVVYEKTWALQYDAKGGIDFVIATGKVKISTERQQIIKFIICETLNFVDCAGE